MQSLKEQVKILSSDEGKLLEADKLTKNQRNSTGLYLVCGDKYIAYDYSERQNWIEFFGKFEKAPKGHSKEFSDPLSAVDWLLSLKKL